MQGSSVRHFPEAVIRPAARYPPDAFDDAGGSELPRPQPFGHDQFSAPVGITVRRPLDFDFDQKFHLASSPVESSRTWARISDSFGCGAASASLVASSTAATDWVRSVSSSP